MISTRIGWYRGIIVSGLTAVFVAGCGGPGGFQNGGPNEQDDPQPAEGPTSPPPAVSEASVRPVWIKPVYRAETESISIPAVFKTVTRRTSVPPIVEVRPESHFVPAVFKNVRHGIWIAPVSEIRQVPITIPAQFQNRSDRVWNGRCYVCVSQRICVCPARTEYVAKNVVVQRGHYQYTYEQVCVRPAHTETISKKVVVQAGHYECKTEQVCVRPPTVHHRRHWVLERPGHWTTVPVVASAGGNGAPDGG